MVRILRRRRSIGGLFKMSSRACLSTPQLQRSSLFVADSSVAADLAPGYRPTELLTHSALIHRDRLPKSSPRSLRDSLGLAALAKSRWSPSCL